MCVCGGGCKTPVGPRLNFDSTLSIEVTWPVSSLKISICAHGCSAHLKPEEGIGSLELELQTGAGN